MVNFDILNKNCAYSLEEFSQLEQIINEYPYFEYALIKYLEIGNKLEIDTDHFKNINARHLEFQTLIGNEEKPKKNYSKECGKTELIRLFLEGFEYPTSPSCLKSEIT